MSACETENCSVCASSGAPRTAIAPAADEIATLRARVGTLQTALDMGRAQAKLALDAMTSERDRLVTTLHLSKSGGLAEAHAHARKEAAYLRACIDDVEKQCATLEKKLKDERRLRGRMRAGFVRERAEYIRALRSRSRYIGVLVDAHETQVTAMRRGVAFLAENAPVIGSPLHWLRKACEVIHESKAVQKW